MLRNNADVRRCLYFELGLPVVIRDSFGQNGLELVFLKQLKHKANKATDEVRVENRNHGLA